MSEIAELERRITGALERIARGFEAGLTAAAPDPGFDGVPDEALENERLVNAQLTERVRALKDKQETVLAALDAKVARLTEALDAQGLDLARLNLTNSALRENTRVLREALEAGVGDAQLINTSMAVELAALRASRSAEIAEMDAILAELRPLIEETADA